MGIDRARPTEREFASWRSYWLFAREVRGGHRFVWSEEVERFLGAVRETARGRAFGIPKGQPFYRAQVGWEHEVKELEDGTMDGPLAFCAARMKPDAAHATGGRANAPGIPALYLALDPDTAIAEVRPWIGSQVSVSQFRTNRKLKALDLTEEFGKHWMPEFLAKEARFLPVDSDGKAKSVWTEIDNAFSRPVSREDESTEYVPTQILAELFRSEGYEALAYRSLLGKQGFNVVLFDPADADAVDGRPYEVRRVDVVGEQAGNPWVRRSVKSPGAGRGGDG